MAKPRYNITVYNTLTREKEEFVPLVPGQVGLYTCGPTVYNFAHIGNMRTYIFEDVLVRALKYDGYEVDRVMNITDVGHLTSDADEGEDKMIKAMRREGKSVLEIAEFYTAAFFRDAERLNIETPTHVTPATQHIPEMISLIECLVDKGHAYVIKDGVYYDVATFPDYGKLSGQSLEEMEAGARVEVNADKHNPADFALWKMAGKGHAMRWPSPWGEGYPGWHIECSAMSMKYLGETFDIHCGGVDHIPIHHENEIAQSEGCTGKQFARYWMHAEFLLINAGKMSKSKGAAANTEEESEDGGDGGRDMGEGIEPLNTGGGGFLTVQSLVDKGIDPLAYRYFCLNAKYRTQLNYTDEAIQAAARGLGGLYDFVTRAAGLRAPTKDEGRRTKDEDSEDSGQSKIGAPSGPPKSKIERNWQQPYKEKFVASINDDLNMPGALAAMFELINEANRRHEPAAILPTLYDWDSVFGLRLKETAQARLSEKLPHELEKMLEERQAARNARDFKRADALRADLRAAGIEIEDTPQGVRWKRV